MAIIYYGPARASINNANVPATSTMLLEVAPDGTKGVKVVRWRVNGAVLGYTRALKGYVDMRSASDATKVYADVTYLDDTTETVLKALTVRTPTPEDETTFAAPTPPPASPYDTSALADSPVLLLAAKGNALVDVLSVNHVAGGGSAFTTTSPDGSGAVRLDGTTGYFTIPDSSAFSVPATGQLTYEVLLRPDVLEALPASETSGEGPICYPLVKGTRFGATGNQEYVLRFYDKASDRPNRLSGYVFSPAGSEGAGSYTQEVMTPGQWVHIAVVFDNINKGADGWGTVRMYRNGVLKDTDSWGAPYNVVAVDGDAPLHVGARPGKSYFPGAIGKVALFPAALSAARIAAHASAALTAPGPTPPPPAPTPAPLPVLAKTPTGKLTIAGKAANLAMANFYDAVITDNAPTSSNNVATIPPRAQITAGLQAMVDTGHNAARIHSLLISQDKPGTAHPTPATWDEAVLVQGDYVLAECARLGLIVWAPAGDRWAFYHGGFASYADARGLGGLAAFLANTAIPAGRPGAGIGIQDEWFANHFRVLMDRTNTITGRKWREEIAVLESGNEVYDAAFEGFHKKFTAYVKGLASGSRITADGSAASGNYPRAWALDDPNTDIVGTHLYDDQRLNGARVRDQAAAANAKGKAYVVGEYDWRNTKQPASANGGAIVAGGPTRAAFLADLRAYAQGAAWWSVTTTATSGHDDGYQLLLSAPQNSEQSAMKTDVAAFNVPFAAATAPTAPPPSPTVTVFSDTFDGDGPLDAGRWGVTSTTGTVVARVAGRAQIKTATLGGYNDRLSMVSKAPAATKRTVTGTLIPDGKGAANEAYFRVNVRAPQAAEPDEGNRYYLQMSAVDGAWGFFKKVGATETILSGATGTALPAWAAGVPVYFEVISDGPRFEVRVWTGATRPTAPSWSTTTETSITAAGYTGLALSGGTPKRVVTWLVDDWVVDANVPAPTPPPAPPPQPVTPGPYDDTFDGDGPIDTAKWTTAANPGGNVARVAGRARLTLGTAGNYTDRVMMASKAPATTKRTLSGKVIPDGKGQASEAYFKVAVRTPQLAEADAGNRYYLQLYAQDGSWGFYKNVGGVETRLSPAGASNAGGGTIILPGWTAGQPISFEIVTDGPKFDVRVWTGATRPAAATWSTTTETSVTAPGYCGVNFNGPATARAAVWFLDDWSLTPAADPTPPPVPPTPTRKVTTTRVRGVNSAGGEFGTRADTATGTYDPDSAFAYYAARGATLVRIPFLWERVQPALNGPLATAEVARLRAAMTSATSRGMVAILDCHNYARYTPAGGAELVLGAGTLTKDHLADLWSKVAAAFRDEPLAHFGLMNEPYNLPETRGTIATNRVPNGDFTTAAGWSAGANTTGAGGPGRTGTGVRATAVAAGRTDVNGPKIDVTPGETLGVSAWSRSEAGAMRQGFVQLNYFTAADAYVSTGVAGFATDVAGQWSEHQGVVTVPATATIAKAQVILSVQGQVAGDSVTWDDVVVGAVTGQVTGAKVWEVAAQAAMTAVRNAGATNFVWVAGHSYSSAASWWSQHPTWWISDPAGRSGPEGHYYFDADNSGTFSQPYAASVAHATQSGYTDLAAMVRADLTRFGQGAKDRGLRSLLGEIGWTWKTEVEQWNAVGEVAYQVADTLDMDVAYWAAGDRWSPDYPLTLYKEGAAKTTSTVVEAHLGTKETPPAPVQPPTPPPASTGPFSYGLADERGITNTATLSDFVAAAGERPAVFTYFQAFDSPFRPGIVENVSAQNIVPMLTLEPWEFTGPVAAKYTLASIIAGAHDLFLLNYFSAIRDTNQLVYLRFAHEMNGDWYPWAEAANGNQPGQYALMWRKVHALAAQVRATNIRWVWCANVAYPGSTALPGLYPGDAYVDVVAVDGYNWGTTQGKAWQEPAALYDATITAITAITSKPLWIAEVGCSDQGGDKAAWIRSFFSYVRASKVQLFSWFQYAKEADWRYNTPAPALAAFKDGAASLRSARAVQAVAKAAVTSRLPLSTIVGGVRRPMVLRGQWTGSAFRPLLPQVLGSGPLAPPATTAPVTAPTGMVVSASADRKVTVTCDPYPGASAYRVYESGNANAVLAEVTVPSRVSGVLGGTSFNYSISAVVGGQESPRANVGPITVDGTVRSTANGTANPGPTPPPPAQPSETYAGTLYDTFATADAALWTGYSQAAPRLFADAGSAVVTCAATYPKMRSTAAWDLTSGSITVGVTSLPAAGAGTKLSMIELAAGTSGSRFVFGRGADGMVLETHVNGVRGADQYAAGYDAATVSWKVRRAGATLVFETSADGTVFTPRFTVDAATFPLTYLTVALGCGFYGTEATPGEARYGFVAASAPRATTAAPTPPAPTPPPAGGGGSTPPASGQPNYQQLWHPNKAITQAKTTYPEIASLDRDGQAQWITGTYDLAKIAGYKTDAGAKTMHLSLYAIPNRDNGNFSGGGFPDRASYLQFARDVRDRIGAHPTVLVLEADALGLGRNLDAAGKAERMETLRQLIAVFAPVATTHAYIDASMWVPAGEQADLLKAVGVATIAGFVINVSAFNEHDVCTAYGDSVVAALNTRAVPGARYCVDSSRNGVGELKASYPGSGPWFSTNQTWCNPPGRRPGRSAGSTDAAHPAMRSTLLVKSAGESDGTFPTTGQSGIYGANAPAAGTLFLQWCRDFLGLNPGNGSGTPYPVPPPTTPPPAPLTAFPGLRYAPPAGSETWRTLTVQGTGAVEGAEVIDCGRVPTRVVFPTNRRVGPVRINGTNGLVVVGAWIDAVPGSSVGGLDQRLLQVTDARGAIHLEGLDFDGLGGDNSRETDGLLLDGATADFTVQNYRVVGLHGKQVTNHADMLQIYRTARSLRVHNMSGASDYQGIKYQLVPGEVPIGSVALSNVDLFALERTDGGTDGKYVLWPNPNGETRTTLEGVRIAPRGGNLAFGVWPPTNYSADPAKRPTVSADGNTLTWEASTNVVGPDGRPATVTKRGRSDASDYVRAGAVAAQYGFTG